MEKGRPHYSLAQMQAEIQRAGRHAFTLTAISGGRAMGLTDGDMLEVVANLTRKDFYKSMTTHHDHSIWQDVYHAVCGDGRVAYIKLTQVAERIVIQFKEK